MKRLMLSQRGPNVILSSRRNSRNDPQPWPSKEIKGRGFDQEGSNADSMEIGLDDLFFESLIISAYSALKRSAGPGLSKTYLSHHEPSKSK